MTTPTSTDEWVTPPEPTPQPGARPASRWSRPRRWLATGGLVAAGLAGGIGIGVAVNHSSNGGQRAVADGRVGAAAPGAGAPNGGFGPDQDGGRDGGQGGGQAGEQHVQGTVTAVGGSSMTVKTASGTSTYHVGSSTQILRNGSSAKVADLKTGDTVEVHVLSDGTVERIFAGTLPQRPGR